MLTDDAWCGCRTADYGKGNRKKVGTTAEEDRKKDGVIMDG